MKATKALLLCAAFLATPACSQASDVSTTDRAAIEKIVHEYIMENPEIIFEAQIAHEAKQDWNSINSAENAIYNDARDVVIGPDNAKVTIVEFFDYNCSFCKRSTDWLVETIEKHPKDVRVIFKELPILDNRSRTSRMAAKAAIAAHRQGKYLEMHTALMEASGLSVQRVEDIAADIGLDISQLRDDMDDPKLSSHIEDTMILGQKIRPLTGTPFFIIGDEYIAGANVQRLDEMVKTAMKG